MTLPGRHQTTDTSEYTDRLVTQQMAWWKRLIDVQAPYRWNLRSLRPGYTLEIGCGIGRNLAHLKGFGVGVDHAPESVQYAVSRGLTALSPEEFQRSPLNMPRAFDSLLLAHVAEHMTQQEAVDLIEIYLANLKIGGKMILITPQEAGHRSDATHVEFMDFAKLRNIVRRLGFHTLQEYSFPFPRFAGSFFKWNEFVSVSCLPRSMSVSHHTG